MDGWTLTVIVQSDHDRKAVEELSSLLVKHDSGNADPVKLAGEVVASVGRFGQAELEIVCEPAGHVFRFRAMPWHIEADASGSQIPPKGVLYRATVPTLSDALRRLI